MKQQAERPSNHAQNDFKTRKNRRRPLLYARLPKQHEQERDAGYAELRRQLDLELHKKRLAAEEEGTGIRAEHLSKIEKEICELRHTRLAEITKAETVEQHRIRALIAVERAQHAEETRNTIERLQAERGELHKYRGELDAAKDDVTYRETMLSAKQRALESRGNAIEVEVARLVAQRQKSFESSENILRDEIHRLRGALTKTDGLFGCFEELKRRLGDDPERVLLELNGKTDELKALREELATRPPKELRERFGNQQREIERLQSRIVETEAAASEHRQRLASENELRGKLSQADADNKALRNRVQGLDAECSRLTEELKRMRAAYEREEDREKRISEIEAPHLEIVRPSLQKTDIDEIEWLDGIGHACIDYGLRFHPRILRAFHTALKTSEWSPLTILAGVSGTGKSELPRLYSHFGGMPFMHLSVQPNWDSQESMLGFFNSIDNRFDAQPVLRFLAQTQRKEGKGKDGKDYPGLDHTICMVLLDEMNLAHAELYFAEFLSKLENRRGTKGADVPALDVKLGAGLRPYELRLGRNVLWAGTMNQDETTKALSDKVLDRAIVIHFPRPTSLERRKQLKALPQAGPLLPRKVWESWWSKNSEFTDEDVRPFKGFIEEMNTSLSKAGRALGHRVWQSVEYYMANYPEVMAARKSKDSVQLRASMRIAFEDQLVQKVMPKLRGIETRGRSKSECLDKIRAQLVEQDYQIVDDFDLACEFGYGQFMWQSANYLRDGRDEPPKAPEGPTPSSPELTNGKPTIEDPGKPPDLSFPSADFRPGEPDRQERWNGLGVKQKKMYKAKG